MRRAQVLLRVAILATLAPLPASLMAQEVVQSLPDPAAADLSEALRQLASNPRSLDALISAGQASIKLEDIDAARGFFERAERIAPQDGRVLAGLASINLRNGQAIAALDLFERARLVGVDMSPYAAERGLAHDLVGENALAQEFYLSALRGGEDMEVYRRLALSQAISGDSQSSEATLLPMLQRQDLAAFRTRAFALAISGKTDEAVAIAETLLPPRLSRRMAPYLRYMPRLTRAQQAAAANLGSFPRASMIGVDSAEIAARTDGLPSARPVQTADSRLVPSGRPLGSQTARAPAADASQGRRRVEQGRNQRSGGNTRREATLEVTYAPIEPEQAEEPVVAQTSEPAPEPVVAEAPEIFTPPEITPRPSISVAENEAPAPAPAIGPAPIAAEPAVAQAASEPVNLADEFADFSLPAAQGEPAPGAVDITKIEPKRVAPEPAEPPPPAHPARHWVQVATGKDTAALGFDWRRIKRNADGLLDDLAPHIAKWGESNRLVGGPVSSVAEANRIVNALKEAGVDSFRFASSQGEEVAPLD